jgi:hypothetical protein
MDFYDDSPKHINKIDHRVQQAQILSPRTGQALSGRLWFHESSVPAVDILMPDAEGRERL